MARDLNKFQAIGRLGKDPDMRYTAGGTAVTNFSVATGRQWKDGNGEQQEATFWARCVAWDKLGEICNQYLTKGTRVYIEGRLEERKWSDKDGVERYSTEVVLSDMIILSDKPRSDEDAAPPARPARPTPTATKTPPVSRNQPQRFEDDDIPF